MKSLQSGSNGGLHAFTAQVVIKHKIQEIIFSDLQQGNMFLLHTAKYKLPQFQMAIQWTSISMI